MEMKEQQSVGHDHVAPLALAVAAVHGRPEDTERPRFALVALTAAKVGVKMGARKNRLNS
jgi:hypothetical protein